MYTAHIQRKKLAIIQKILPQFIVIFEFAKMTMTGFTSFYMIFFIVAVVIVVAIKKNEIETEKKIQRQQKKYKSQASETSEEVDFCFSGVWWWCMFI